MPWPDTCGEPPNACTICPASGQQMASTATPMSVASHSPSMPWRIAACRFPAPSCRATAAVVP